MAKSPITDYSKKGKPTLVFGRRGFSEDSLHHPLGLTITKDKNIAIANSKTNEIKVFSLTGKFASSFKLHSVNLMVDVGVSAVTTNQHGNLVASYTDNHEVQMLMAGSGKLKQTMKMDMQNNFKPWGVACDDKNIYVCDRQNSCLRVFTVDGKYQRDIGRKGTGDGEFMEPVGIAIMPNGKLAVTDFENHNIQIFSDQGVFCCTYGTEGDGPGQFNQPMGIAVDRTGFIAVTEWKNNRVQVLDAMGNSVTTFGQQGSAEGDFFSPSGIAITPNGQIVVADFNNNRIQVF
ncbi:E3 ubiquitin-protein ligase TRIM71-like [Anneissia japonica]|uniref:E3 ubiquitin-protein ligase TRIM71-like n=1 Tax=Anneissia japonica TaxID=1529436 RepID=UPI0014255F71|nr:E3 ubiquitin-protein ligase TRIM71-like [Anneissia japonica]